MKKGALSRHPDMNMNCITTYHLETENHRVPKWMTFFFGERSRFHGKMYINISSISAYTDNVFAVYWTLYMRSNRNWLSCIIMWQRKQIGKLPDSTSTPRYRQAIDEENFVSNRVKFMFLESHFLGWIFNCLLLYDYIILSLSQCLNLNAAKRFHDTAKPFWAPRIA